MSPKNRIKPDEHRYFTNKRTADRDIPIDWNEFFKYATDIVIEDQTASSAVDYILHFKTRKGFVSNYFKKLKIQDNRIQNHTAFGFIAGFIGQNNAISSQFKITEVGKDNREELDNDKTDLVLETMQIDGRKNYIYWPPNVIMKELREYRLFIKNEVAVILDPQLDLEGKPSEQYEKLKVFYQTYVGYRGLTYETLNTNNNETSSDGIAPFDESGQQFPEQGP